MSVSLDIHLLSDSVDMYGEPDTSSAYSLSGHVSIRLKSTTSLFDSRQTIRLLLKSLTITFEGQTELINTLVGYVPLRLCSMTRELAPSGAVELHNEGHEDSDIPCTWNVVFNLPLPGWLPASSIFGEADGGIRYALYARANFIYVDDSSTGKSWFSSLCSPLRFRTREVHAKKCDVAINRFTSVPIVPASSTLFPMLNYLVDAKAEHIIAPRQPTLIPHDVLSKVKVLVSIPEQVRIDDSSIPFMLRFRTMDLDESECKRLQITDFSVELEQSEHYRATPSSHYTSHFPVPGEAEQPPHKPLRSPHPLHAVYEFFEVPNDPCHLRFKRTLLMHSTTEATRYRITGDTYIFAQDAEPETPETWYTMETNIPFEHIGHGKHANVQWACGAGLRPSCDSPLFGVHHSITVTITCSYDVPGGTSKATENLQFSLPIQFVEVAPLLPPSSPVLSHGSESSASLTPPSGKGAMTSCAQPLPAYSQLFDENGDRKIDYSIPLPLYEPQSLASSSSLALDNRLPSSERKEIQEETLTLLTDFSLQVLPLL